MNAKIRIISVILAVLLVCPVISAGLAGCGKTPEKEPEKELPSGEGDKEEEPEPEPAVEIPLWADGEYGIHDIARNWSASDSVLSSITSFANGVKKLTAKELPVVDSDEISEKDLGEWRIVIGECPDIPESAEAAKKFALDEYGVCLVGKSVVVFGHTDMTMDKAIKWLLSLIKENVVKNADKSITIRLSSDQFVKQKEPTYFGDFPIYEGAKSASLCEAEQGCLQLNYKNAAATDFETYTASLVADGFRLYGENTIGQNRFATYEKENGAVTVSFYGKKKTMTVLSESLTETSLYREISAGPKVTENTLCVYSLTYEGCDPLDCSGECYVIILEDGRFVIIDGGYAADALHLYRFLEAQNKRADGIRIAAWILSHSHGDHYGCFKSFAGAYASLVTVDYIFANAIGKNYVTAAQYNGFLSDEMPILAQSFKGGGTKIVKPHTGQVFRFGNLSFEVYHTQENYIPGKIQWLNDSSTVMKMTAGGHSVFFTMDGEGTTCNSLLSYYDAADLKADIIQNNHHGYSGITKALIDAVDPTVALWTTSQTSYENRIGSGYTKADNKYLNDHIIAKGGKTYVADGPIEMIPMNYQTLDDVTTVPLP